MTDPTLIITAIGIIIAISVGLFTYMTYIKHTTDERIITLITEMNNITNETKNLTNIVTGLIALVYELKKENEEKKENE
jgi:inner membrane protein involved in colicin E2 resistance